MGRGRSGPACRVKPLPGPADSLAQLEEGKREVGPDSNPCDINQSAQHMGARFSLCPNLSAASRAGAPRLEIVAGRCRKKLMFYRPIPPCTAKTCKLACGGLNCKRLLPFARKERAGPDRNFPCEISTAYAISNNNVGCKIPTEHVVRQSLRKLFWRDYRQVTFFAGVVSFW